MTDASRSRESYDKAFRIGWMGSIALAVAAILGDTLPALILLAGWSVIIPVLLPAMHHWYDKLSVDIPQYILRGPQQ